MSYITNEMIRRRGTIYLQHYYKMNYNLLSHRYQIVICYLLSSSTSAARFIQEGPCDQF